MRWVQHVAAASLVQRGERGDCGGWVVQVVGKERPDQMSMSRTGLFEGVIWLNYVQYVFLIGEEIITDRSGSRR